MSRLWDTNEFWARAGADTLLDEHHNMGPGALAETVARGATIDGDRGYTSAIVRELRKRAAAGLRYWPDNDSPAELYRELAARTEQDEAAPLGSAANPYWWQRL